MVVVLLYGRLKIHWTGPECMLDCSNKILPETKASLLLEYLLHDMVCDWKACIHKYLTTCRNKFNWLHLYRRHLRIRIESVYNLRSIHGGCIRISFESRIAKDTNEKMNWTTAWRIEASMVRELINNQISAKNFAPISKKEFSTLSQGCRHSVYFLGEKKEFFAM